MDLFPDLRNFNDNVIENGTDKLGLLNELGLFKECWESLRRLLPNKLRTEPLVLGALLSKMNSRPVDAGFVLVDLYQIDEVNDK